MYSNGRNDYPAFSPPFDPNMPVSPPPPYEAVVNFQQPRQSNAFHQHQHQCQPHPHPQQPQAGVLRKKKSGWPAVCQRPQVPPRGPWEQGQRQQSSTDLVAAGPRRSSNECPVTRIMIQTGAGLDTLAERVCDVFHRTDTGAHNENNIESLTRDLSLDDRRYRAAPKTRKPSAAEMQVQGRSKTAIINIQKTWMYSNSRLRPFPLPYTPYMPSWEIFCAAAKASVDVYKRPKGVEKDGYVEADWRKGTKAMVLRSTPVKDKNRIVIAIRGSQLNIVDWAVNFTIDPTPPIGFLDDEGNACHEGFLQVAQSMVGPIARRLRELLRDIDSDRPTSLLFTGHSAGGAIANLLYVHMHSRTVQSELTRFNGVFKHVHCVTFGVPPVSLLPLQKTWGHQYDNNMFVSFVNEGDPFVRADCKYMKSLMQLFATPAPPKTQNSSTTHGLQQRMSRQRLRGQGPPPSGHPVPSWEVPHATLSNAGQIVVLREKPWETGIVEAVDCTDDELRGKVFGDPVMHHMDVYQHRIIALAHASVDGSDTG